VNRINLDGMSHAFTAVRSVAVRPAMTSAPALAGTSPSAIIEDVGNPRAVAGRSSGELQPPPVAAARRRGHHHQTVGGRPPLDEIYSDLLEFKRGILGRTRRDLPGLHPTAQKAAAVDLQIIESQMLGSQERLDLWFTRIWELQGLQLDATDRIVRHRGRDVTPTKREFQLLSFLLDHPHRCFTTAQILGQAWADPALFPEEVRNYVGRLRKILRELEIPVDLVNKPGRGYSLVFRPD
jgi:Transcriptional regulatory protein, C terminal